MAIGLSETPVRKQQPTLAERIYGRRPSTTMRVAALIIVAAAIYFAARIAPVLAPHTSLATLSQTAHEG